MLVYVTTKTKGGLNLPGFSPFRVYGWEYDNEAQRLAATGFAAVDVGRVAHQKSPDSLWVLIAADPPAWDQILTSSLAGQSGGIATLDNDGTVPVAQLASFVHSQATVSDTWVIDHPLNRYPAVTVIDSSGQLVIGAVNYDSASRITIKFSAAFSGTANLGY